MTKGDLKGYTEALLCSAQEQSIRSILSTILTKLPSHPFVGCVVTISHIVSECDKLAQKDYNRRHDSVGRYKHWQFCEKLRFNRARFWYKHEPESVNENENFKIIWDFTIQCDHMIET